VIAWLEGSDPGLKNEVLVIGAHYDHVGSMSIHKADTDYIYNGADDNASGTSGVLAVAKAFGSMSENPKRSVLFMAFAGEEKGLLGSASYVRKPLWPLEQTVAMLNLDMISRNSIDSVELVGARLSPGLVKIVRKANREEGMVLTESTSPYLDGGSDHASFFRKGIPALFFFAGFHSDYHEVTDNPDRINAEKAARISRLAFLSAWQIANEKKHYKIVSTAVAEAE
jgi:Zn-dependent M28 family amino/carboxypeptidase